MGGDCWCWFGLDTEGGWRLLVLDTEGGWVGIVGVGLD